MMLPSGVAADDDAAYATMLSDAAAAYRLRWICLRDAVI